MNTLFDDLKYLWLNEKHTIDGPKIKCNKCPKYYLAIEAGKYQTKDGFVCHECYIITQMKLLFFETVATEGRSQIHTYTVNGKYDIIEELYHQIDDLKGKLELSLTKNI